MTQIQHIPPAVWWSVVGSGIGALAALLLVNDGGSDFAMLRPFASKETQEMCSRLPSAPATSNWLFKESRNLSQEVCGRQMDPSHRRLTELLFPVFRRP